MEYLILPIYQTSLLVFAVALIVAIVITRSGNPFIVTKLETIVSFVLMISFVVIVALTLVLIWDVVWSR